MKLVLLAALIFAAGFFTSMFSGWIDSASAHAPGGPVVEVPRASRFALVDQGQVEGISNVHWMLVRDKDTGNEWLTTCAGTW